MGLLAYKIAHSPSSCLLVLGCLNTWLQEGVFLALLGGPSHLKTIFPWTWHSRGITHAWQVAPRKSNFHLSGPYRMIKNFPPCRGINSSKVPLFAHSFVSSLFLLSKKGELYYCTNESITRRQILRRLLLICKSYEVADVPQKLTYSAEFFLNRARRTLPGQCSSGR